MQRTGRNEQVVATQAMHSSSLASVSPIWDCPVASHPRSCCLLEPWPSAWWGWRSFSLSLSASVLSGRWNYELQEKRSKKHIKEFPCGFWIRGLIGLGLLALDVLFSSWSTWVCFSLKDVDKLERESRGRATKMMYGLERRRITVYKYLKGNIKEGERLFTALERSLTANKSLHLGAGENWVELKTQSLIRVMKQWYVIFTLVCVAKVRMAGIRDVFHTEDSCVIVNNVFLIPCCEARRVDNALFFAFGI